MSPQSTESSIVLHSSSEDVDAVDFDSNDTELTLGLGLPGTKTGTKRSFSGTATKSPTPKAQVVGWPPVRASRKNAMMKSNCKYVKVAVDGAPYLRKVDLEIYESYDHLLRALETMFGCFLTIRNNQLMNEKKFMDPAAGNGIEYMPTYEDKDGDWMLVGDVPWKMFVESCKRIRLMISSDDNIDLGPRTTSKCTGSSEKIS